MIDPILRLRPQSLSGLAVFGLLLCLMATGCGARAPWDIAKVSGKLTFADGSPIKAKRPDGTPMKIMRITLQFIPQDPPTSKYQPKVAVAEVDVETGLFDSATTWRPAGDGAIVGNHKILFQIYQQLDDGSVHPVSRVLGIPEKYFSLESTPLKVEVTKRGDNYFPLTVEHDRGAQGKE